MGPSAWGNAQYETGTWPTFYSDRNVCCELPKLYLTIRISHNPLELFPSVSHEKNMKNKVNLQQKIKQHLCISTKMPEGILQETKKIWCEAL